MVQGLRLTQAAHKFNRRRGIYTETVLQFMNCGVSEAKVEAENVQNAYLGLRSAVNKLGLKGTVYVGRQNGEIHLIREVG